MHEHVPLAVFRPDGTLAGSQPVEVELLEDGAWLVLHTAGMVDGAVAGDVVRRIDDAGRFQVLTRGPNVALKVFARATRRSGPTRRGGTNPGP